MKLGFYRAFEDKYRGSRELIKSRLMAYLPFLEKLKTIHTDLAAIDLGCGRGEWLELLAENGFHAQGIDMDEGMLEGCDSLRLSTSRQDIFEWLKAAPDESYLIISGFHVAEHLLFEQLQILFSESLRILKPGGLLILETPNPENLVVGTSSFYLDPTHQRPITPELLSYLPEYYGYIRNRIIRLQELPELRTIQEPQLADVFYGVSPDYAVIAQKEGSDIHFNALNPEFERPFGLDLRTVANRYEQKVMNIASVSQAANSEVTALKEKIQEHQLNSENTLLMLQTEVQEQNLRYECEAVHHKNTVKEQMESLKLIENCLVEEIKSRTVEMRLMKERFDSDHEILNMKIERLESMLTQIHEQNVYWWQAAEREKKRNEALGAEYISLKGHCDQWRKAAEASQQQLTAILTSPSWRLTLPFRLIARFFRQI